MSAEIEKLAARVEALQRYSNEVDVLVQIALFEPDYEAVSVRANAAGTKVIYTAPDGSECTYCANDWTISAERRADVAAELRARARPTTTGESGL